MPEYQSAGLGDPYWYEWTVGLEYVVEMLDPDSPIVGVTLQADGQKGLDDVVVRYTDNRLKLVQVKHSRIGEALTFGDLIERVNGDASLLEKIARAWKSAQDQYGEECHPIIVTNRPLGIRAGRSGSDDSVARPPLARFLAEVIGQAREVESLAEIEVPTQWEAAWRKEWLAHLQELGPSTVILQFLQLLTVQGSWPDQGTLVDRIEERLAALFGVERKVAHHFLVKLDHALRKWATSRRGSVAEVSREAVYEVLCLEFDVPIGEHHFPPPEPFVDSRRLLGDHIAQLLCNRTAPIVFLVGQPGSGKTAITSYLANRREPVIDLRFHAFRPITPENQLLPIDIGRTTSARALWSDLLLQVRANAQGRLAELNVPVHAGSLSEDALRDNVLRICEELGEREGRTIVIAIDGIDHAARAGVSSDSFLSSLPHPDLIPPRVALMIGGQPPDDYPQYPAWLRNPGAGVCRIDVTPLAPTDTLTLVTARLPTVSEAEQESVARDIDNACEGNTLSTVFAIEEAVLCALDLAELPKRLSERKMSAGVGGYYEIIWNASIAGMPAHIASARVAACLCMMPSRVDAAALQHVLTEPRLTQSQLVELLRSLRPLVVEEEGGFRVFHNDVRVFLTGRLLGDQGIHRESAGLVAEHLRDRAGPLERHSAALALFGVAGRHREQASMYSPAYVLEGVAAGIQESQLAEQGVLASHALAHCEGDWDLVHSVATGLQTLEQWRKASQWRGEEVRRWASGPRQVPTQTCERRVLPLTSWSPEILTAVLKDLEALIGARECERARAASERWFGGLTPWDVVEAARAKDRAADDQTALQSLGERLGRIAAGCGHILAVSEMPAAEAVECGYGDALLEAAVQTSTLGVYRKLLRRVKWCTETGLCHAIVVLVDRRDVLRLRNLLRSFVVGNAKSWALRLQAAVGAIVSGDRELRNQLVSVVLNDRREAIAQATSSEVGARHEYSEMWKMTALSFILGAMEVTRSPSAIREEIESTYHTQRRDERGDSGIAVLLHAGALLGMYAGTRSEGVQRPPQVTPQLASRTVAVILRLVGPGAQPWPLGFPSIARPLVRGFVDCAQADGEMGTALAEQLAVHLGTQPPPHALLEVMWSAMLAAGGRQALVAYADLWVGGEGRIWAEELSERHAIAERFIALLTECGEDQLADLARSRLSWSQVGYSGHKEYALYQPLEWFTALIPSAPQSWELEGMRLLALSREASRLGDNRAARPVATSVVGAACAEGAGAVWRLTQGETPCLTPDGVALIDGFTAAGMRSALPAADLALIWAYGTGSLCWQVAGDRGQLAGLRQALLANAGGAAATLDSAMQAQTPMEAACEEEERAKEERVAEVVPVEHHDLLVALHDACGRGQWRRVGVMLDACPPHMRSAASELVRGYLLNREEQVWSWDSAGQAFTRVFPLLSPAERWGFVVKAILCDEAVPARKSYLLAENLESLALEAAKVEGEEALRRGLMRAIEMQELWVDAGGRLPGVTPIVVAESPARLLGWGELLLTQLVKLLAYDEQTYLQAALRGVARMLESDPSLFPHAVLCMRAAEGKVQRRVLYLAEALVCVPGAAPLKEWLEELVSSPRLDVALAAWNALDSARRACGGANPIWPDHAAIPSMVIPVARPLVARGSNRRGLLATAERASEAILDNVEAAAGEALPEIRARFADAARAVMTESHQRLLRDAHVSDLTTGEEDEAEYELLFRLLREAERGGRFRSIPLARLQQAVIPFVDPYVVRSPERRLSEQALPAIDRDLDQLVEEGRVILEEEVSKALFADLTPQERLLGGFVRSYSDRYDVRLVVDHVARRATRTEAGRPAILQGRASLAYEPWDTLIKRDGHEMESWLTADNGGLIVAFGGTLELFPSRLWREVLGWEPSSQQPLRWMRGHRCVAWYEKLAGQVRHIYPSDMIFRQPSIGRWVCVAEEWDRIEQTVGQLTQCRRVEVASF